MHINWTKKLAGLERIKPTEIPKLQGRMIKWRYDTQISSSLDKEFKTKNFKTI